MNEFKYQFVNLILLVLLGGSIYWAFTHIDNGVYYDRDAVVAEESEQVLDNEELVLFQNTQTETPTADRFAKQENSEKAEVKQDEKKYSEEETFLLKKLQGLIDDNINMKQGSFGTRVGTVQKFLNLYLDTSKTVDNDYGPGTFADVKKFQKSEGLVVDGLAGPTSYKKMIQIIKEGKL